MSEKRAEGSLAATREVPRPLQRRELQKLRKRLDIVLDHLADLGVSEIARKQKTARSTVRKWIRRFAKDGIPGLLSQRSAGRPREIRPIVREEVVRLPKETRPPEDLGEQWTSRSLGKAFGVSSSWISNVWRESGFEPPLHLQQVRRNPDRMMTLEITLRIPAWLRMHLQILCAERDISPDMYAMDAILGFESLHDRREDVWDGIEDWSEILQQRPRVDPRTAAYRTEIERRALQP